MSVPSAANNSPITSKRQLVENIAGGGKPKRDWRIGTEHEKFVFRLKDRRRIPYEGPDGIRALLTSLERFGWTPIMDGPNPIGLKKDGASVSLEPGGQLELSGAPLKSIHQTCEEVNKHLAEVKEVDAELGVGLLGLGFDPQWPRGDVPWMPKGRYKIMREYMPKRGKLGLDMMLRTCTVQVNLDFADEADMIKKFRTSLALQPVATALFANSPFTEGKPNGFLSYRSHIWTDTDPDRSGMIPFVFEPGMSFERYVDYMLDVPMYFVYRDGKYIDASGQSFRDFMQGKLPAYPGQIPTMSDWADHLTTAFPEVRLKTYLEMRGADGGPWRRLCALPALWVGLLYDAGALDAAWDLCKDWTIAEMAALRRDVPKYGLKTPFRRGALQDVALRMVAIARQGLAARAMADKCGMDETGFINTLQDIADRGQTPAEELLEAYKTRWNGNIDKVYDEYAY